MLKILILKTNELDRLTINSIEKNMPEATYEVVKCENQKKIRTALEHSKGKTPMLVVTSGLVLDVQDFDIPQSDILSRYAICCSRAGVYVDHGYRNNYKTIKKILHKGHIDLSIFVINPGLWNEIPESDTGALKDKKILYMPRYMNHKTDVQVNDALSAYPCLQYGALGLSAAVYNYVDNIASGEATVAESYAYCFDKLVDYTEGLDEVYINNINKLAKKTQRISKFRDAYNNINKET